MRSPALADGQIFLRQRDARVRLTNPHGGNGERTETTDIHRENDEKAGGDGERWRDPDRESDRADGGYHFKQNGGEREGRISTVMTMTNSRPSEMIVVALWREGVGIRRRNASGGRFVEDVNRERRKTKNVVVFIPPPVDPGDAPMNISTIMTSKPASLKLPNENVANPAVRAVMLEKNAPSHVMSAPSVSFRSTVPEASRIPVMDSTTFVWREHFLHFRTRATSVMTKNPMPPTITRSAVIRFSAASPA